MRVLLIGGCGYIGSALFKTLNQQYTCDTVDLEFFGNFINPLNYKMGIIDLTQSFLDNYDVIILTAANSSVSLCKDVFDTFNNNVVNFFNLITKIKKQKFIYASSSCVYVTSDNNLKVETDALDPLDGLTLSKTTIDHLMKLTKIEYYGLRFGSVNGWSPNMRLDLMINAMTMSAIQSKKVNVFNGHAHRPILSIEDLCNSVKTIIECKQDKRGIYNLNSFNENILEIGKKVAEATNSELVNKGENFTYDFKISSNKFIETFNYTPKATINSIIESILNNPHNPKWSKRESFLNEV
jgi:nucleoside-diphosphate-sugar epimerase